MHSTEIAADTGCAAANAVHTTPNEPPAPGSVQAEPITLALLSNLIAAYRVSTFEALARRVRRLPILITSDEVADGARESALEIHSVPSLHLPAQRRHRNGFIERYTIHLPYGTLAALRKVRPDVILAGELGPRTLAAVIYKLLWRCPLVIHADLSEETEIGRGRLRWALRKLLLARADHVLVNGESGARYIASLGHPRSRISKLPYATDRSVFTRLERSPRKDDPRVRLVYVGQLIERKGLRPFVEALTEVLRARPEVQATLSLVGDGDQREILSSMVTPDNLRLEIPGPAPYAELPSIYAGADVFVIPTLADTWGLVVNESMASGLPVLGSLQSQAVQELVEEGASGWVFDATSPSSLRSAIERMLDTPEEQRARMGEQARRRALSVSPESVAERIVSAARTAIAATSRP